MKQGKIKLTAVTQVQDGKNVMFWQNFALLI